MIKSLLMILKSITPMTRINKLKSIEKVIKETDNKIDKLSSKIDKVLHLNQVQLEKEN